MGFNGKSNLDIDRLNQMLEENRQLLNQMTQAEGSCSDGATLPKLLFELVEQATGHGESPDESSDHSRSATPTPTNTNTPMAANEDTTDSCKPETGEGGAVGAVAGVVKKYRKRSSGGAGAAGGTAASLKSHEPEIMGKVASAQEIIGNLPKVWKVLMELLSHHKIERVQFEELPSSSGVPASMLVSGRDAGVAGVGGDTHRKPPELSVSKTYIKLKVSPSLGRYTEKIDVCL